MSPMAKADSCSKTGSHVIPLFVVFQTLPAPGPTYIVLEPGAATAMASMRPPWSDGPSGSQCSGRNGDASPRSRCVRHARMRTSAVVA